MAVSLYLLREVAVGQFEGVEQREALVVPQQLLLQEADGVQREDDGFVFQQTVDVQPWPREERQTDTVQDGFTEGQPAYEEN